MAASEFGIHFCGLNTLAPVLRGGGGDAKPLMAVVVMKAVASREFFIVDVLNFVVL
jgi:hypothetical protein